MLRTTGFRAAAAIPPCRFVVLAATAYHLAVADGTNLPIGVSPEGSSAPPIGTTPADTTDETPLAAVGEAVFCYSVGDVCPVTAGATVAAGDRLVSAADGRAVPLSGSGVRYVGGVALEGGVAGDRVRMLVLPHVQSAS